MAFQVLKKASKHILVKSIQSKAPRKTSWCLQFLEIWRGAETCIERPPTELCVFPIGEAIYIDLMDVVSSLSSQRKNTICWTRVASDLDGCEQWVGPQIATTQISLDSAHIPVLCLRDALLADGWLPAPHRVDHTPAAPRIFDNRKLTSSRAYMQALLMAPEIWAKENASFLSAKTAAYYRLLMKSCVAVNPALSARECETALESIAAGSEFPTPARLRGIPALADVARFCLEDGEIDDGDCDAPALEDDHIAEGPPEHGEHGEHGASVDDDIDNGDDGSPPFEWPSTLLGTPFVPEAHEGRADFGFRVNCLWHDDCRKYRNWQSDTERYGPLAPVYFLGAWLRKEGLTRARHRDWKPKHEDIVAFMASYGGV